MNELKDFGRAMMGRDHAYKSKKDEDGDVSPPYVSIYTCGWAGGCFTTWLFV